jgi:hypothetical protein
MPVKIHLQEPDLHTGNNFTRTRAGTQKRDGLICMLPQCCEIKTFHYGSVSQFQFSIL